MRVLPVRVLFPVLVLLVGAFRTMPQERPRSSDRSITVIEVSAKKYGFAPHEVHVQKGTKVSKVHSVDEPHGIKLSLEPVGSKDKWSPGLLLTDPAGNGRVEKNEVQVLEFVALKAGRTCSSAPNSAALDTAVGRERWLWMNSWYWEGV